MGADSRISNCLNPFGGRSKTRRSSIWAKAGVSSCKAWAKSDNASGRPSTSISTPAEVLRTQPVNSRRWASPYTNGLNPTPCTMPVICILKPLLATDYLPPATLPLATCHFATCYLPRSTHSPTHANQSSNPWPVRQDSGKVTKPGFSASTPRRK